MARSTFYYNHRPKPDKWAVERRRIAELYHQNRGRYGYRRLAMAMRNEGYVINGKTVRKLMAEAGIKCQVRMKKYKSYKGEVGKIAPNLLERDFKADAPMLRIRRWSLTSRSSTCSDQRYTCRQSWTYTIAN